MEEEKIAIFTLGLPGSGKSTWLTENVDFTKYIMVSADEIRVRHPKYDPKNPEAIHEECVKMAEEMMYLNSTPANRNNLVMDGGGINNNYTARIICKMKDRGYKTKVVFIDTPVEVCVERNKGRVASGERFVPISAIIDKSYKLRKAIETLSQIADEFEVVKYFTDEYTFVDMDGTISEYQQLPVDEHGDVNFVEYEVFKYAKPVTQVIDKLYMMYQAGKKIHIVSVSANSICNKEKIEWLAKYAPFIPENNIYFVGNRNFKYVFLYELIRKMKLHPSQCMAIDDDHAVLTSYKPLGINAVHPSKFLTNY